MDNMISNAFEKFKSLVDTEATIKINGRDYKKAGYTEVYEPTLDPIITHTLQGIVDAIKSDFEMTAIKNDILNIHIASPTLVLLETDSCGPFLQKNILIKAQAYATDFLFGQQYNPEEFIIALNSQFIDSPARTSLLNLCSSITKGTSGTVTDNGVSQQMEVKAGVSMRHKVAIENPFSLKPFRTFSEIEQPESDFVFRIRDNGGVTCALYEADGSAWKVEATNSIKEFLDTALANTLVIA